MSRKQHTEDELAQYAAERENRLATVATVADTVADALGTGGVWGQVLATAGRFPNLSPTNCLVAAGTMAAAGIGEDYTDLRSLAKWRAEGRRAAKGERARVRLFAPKTRRSSAEGETDPVVEAGKVLAGWTTFVVFDVSQTTAMREGQEPPAPSPVPGSVPAEMGAALLAGFAGIGGGDPLTTLAALAALEHPAGSLPGIPGLVEAEAAAAAFVAALMLGARGIAAPAAPAMLVGLVTVERRGPLYDSARHVITAGRALALAAQAGTVLA